MRGVTSWNFTPYVEPHKKQRGESPYICRIAPFKNGFTADYIDNNPDGSGYYVSYGIPGQIKETIPADGGTFTIKGIQDHTDFEFYIRRGTGATSSTRLVRTGNIPGTVINYVHPRDTEYRFSGWYPCSPSIVRLADGRLLASMDMYKSSYPQNLTMLFRSDDNGEHWRYLTDLFPCFWGKLFLHNDGLYMLGVSREYGDLLIGRSYDGGENWTVPTVLFRGRNSSEHPGIHRAPMPFYSRNGLLMTDVQYGATQCGLMFDGVISVRSDRDLLDAGNWVLSDLYAAPPEELKESTDIPNGIEGNIIDEPNGNAVIFLRYDRGKALVLNFDPANPENAPTFNSIINFPSTASKFEIYYDKPSGYYVSIVDYPLEEPRTERNLLTLIYSRNMKEWKTAKHIIDHRYDDPDKTGFQYVSFLIEENDIIFESRTAYNGADSYHNSNCVTFHRIREFRKYLI